MDYAEGEGTGTGPPATVVHGLRFVSDTWVNLHHTLYAAAWAERAEAGTFRALAGTLPEPLDAPLSADEEAAWRSAVAHYDQHVASRHLLFGRGMREINEALAAGNLRARAINRDHRRALESVEPVYGERFWPAHDAANLAWIRDAADRVSELAPGVVPRLEEAYGTRWPAESVRVDVVRVGAREGAYTTHGPAHITIASGDPDIQGWAEAEIVFHEASHLMVAGLSRAIDRELGRRRSEHGQLWHVVLFYIAGAIVSSELRDRGVDYRPYLYATGLFDRAWSRYRRPVEGAWQPYVEGRVAREDAIAETVAALPP